MSFAGHGGSLPGGNCPQSGGVGGLHKGALDLLELAMELSFSQAASLPQLGL
jgi:hypothetical protein